MPEKKRFWTPTGAYDFNLIIDDLDYSQDLLNVKILTSITVPYQTVLLTLNLDPDDIILKRVYGQSPIKLTVILQGAANELNKESIDFELIYLTSEFDIPTRSMTTQDVQKDRTKVTIPTVCQIPFEYMTTMVNNVHHAKKIDEIIEDIVGNTGAELDLETTGLNTNTLDQVVIPPSTVYKCIQYLDRLFGIYNGIAIITCHYDGTLLIKNLNQNMNMSQTFTMYQLADNDKDFQKIADKCADGKHFYTSKHVNTTYSANVMFSVLSPTLRYIVKPRDTLYHTIEKDLNDFCLEYGLLSNKETEIYHNTTGIKTDKRITYYKDQTGYDTDDTFINANLSKAVSSLVTLSMDLDRDMMILNLMNVGESVSFISKTLEMNQFSNKYILKSSEINFNKSGTWQGSARVHLIRTNRSSN